VTSANDMKMTAIEKNSRKLMTIDGNNMCNHSFNN